MENRRTSSRMKESRYKSMASNKATHPINLDHDDFFGNSEGSSSKAALKGKAVAKMTKEKMNIDKSKSNMKEGVEKEKTKTEVRKRKNIDKSTKTKKKEENEDPIIQITKRNHKTSNKKQKLTDIGNDVATKKKKEKKDNIHNEFQRLSTRMSPNSLFHAIKSLSNNQREMVKAMGFGSILELKIQTLPGKLSYHLVEKYNSSTSSINFKNSELKITKKTVEAMLGLPYGGVDFKILNECKKTHPLLVKWKQQFKDGKFNNGNYLKKIRGSREADDLFKLNFLTLFINTFAETEKMGSCKIDFLEKLVHVDDISTIDWCQYMIDCLEKSKCKWRQDDKNCYYTGPVTLLMLAYVDRVVCEDLQLERLRPFVTEVDSEHLRMLEEYEVEKGQFGTLHIREQVENDDHEEIGEEELSFNENEVPLQSVEEYCANLDRMYKRILEEKKKMEAAIVEGLMKYPNNERLKEWVIKMEELFSETTVSRFKTTEFQKANEDIEAVADIIDQDVNKKKRNVKRIVEVKDIGQQEEKLVAQVILASTKDKRDIVWKTNEGYGMHLEFAQKLLTPKMKVDSNVIDCWAIMLNKSQVSNSRLFFTTNALTDTMIDEREPQNFRYNDFKESLKAYINLITNKEDLSNIDLVFFPIVDGEKYYLVCFNLKRCVFMIIDNKKNEGSVESTYGKRPHILQSFFCAYLFKVGHKKANKLLSKNASMVKMKCQSESDDGIFLMRYMESYKGDGVSKWDCGVEVESRSQETYLLRLRYKYLSKLMLSDFNIMKDEFLKELDEFGN